MYAMVLIRSFSLTTSVSRTSDRPLIAKRSSGAPAE